MPSLYAGWLGELGLEMPVEELATCSNCPMCVDNPAEPESTFDPSVKCCSYNPVLPNFLVGMILADDDPAGARGRESVLVRMRDRSATTPLGVGFRADLRLIYETGNVFGRSPTHRCPHYMDGLCGIWPYRNSVCSTWFCKHVRGRAGQRAWVKLRDLLAVVEADLALVCALEVDRVEDIGLELGALHAKPSREAVTQAAVPVEAEREFKARWSTWADRVDEFYMKCATVARIGAFTVGHQASSLGRSYEKTPADRERSQPGSGDGCVQARRQHRGKCVARR
jgi:hypothetical protein